MPAKEVRETTQRIDCHGFESAWRKLFILAISFVVLFCFTALGAEKKDSQKQSRYIIRNLRHISAQAGKMYLADIGVSTVSQLGDSNMLLITGERDERIRAAAVLELVDSETVYEIKTIASASVAQSLPSNDDIAERIGDILIGTFKSVPNGADKAKAVIDVYNDVVVSVAPLGVFDKIIAVIDDFEKTD